MQDPNTTPPRGFRPGPFEYHEEIDLQITSLTNMGQGLARTADGWVIFVPFALPGESVRARVFRNQKNYSEADLVEILKPSPARVEPRCPLFGDCGGCQYQNLAYTEQLTIKRQQVEELLSHMSGIEFPVDPVVPSPLEFGYRSKITPHFDKPRSGEIGPIGFQRAGRRMLIDVPQCPIAADEINAALPSLREGIRARASDFKKGATLLIRADVDGTVHTTANAIATDRVGDIAFRYPAGDFFQNNPHILDAFTRHVREQAAANGARFLVDAYCGAGLFALTAASAFERVIGIELTEGSITWARDNAAANHIANAEFHAGKVEELFAKVDFDPTATSIIIDPPRKGCSEDFLRQLFAFAPETVVYVSCNPATQLRDLGLFLEAGYTLTKVRPFDLFPQTKHLECVMTLRKK